MYSVVDIGSNTIRLCIYEYKDGKIITLLNKKEAACLAGYIKDGIMSEEGINAACDALERHKKRISGFGVKSSSFFATAALRNIKNSRYCIEKISERTGLDITLLSGKEEAMCDFAGAVYEFSFSEGVVADIGGGSSETVYFKDGGVLGLASLPVGSLSIFRDFVSGSFPSAGEVLAVDKAAKKLMEKMIDFPIPPGLPLCGIGGSIRAALNLYNYYYREENNMVMIPGKFEALLNYILNLKEREELIRKIAPDRINTLIPGMLILNAITKRFSVKTINVTDCGVREGFLLRHCVNKEENNAF